MEVLKHTKKEGGIMKKIFEVVLIIVVVIVVIFILISCTREKTLPIPRSEVIEHCGNNIYSSKINNIIIKRERVGLGVGVGVGVGTIQYTIPSENAFLKLTGQHDIFTDVQKIDGKSVGRIYASNYKNGAVFFYVIRVTYKDWQVEWFDDDSVKFWNGW